MLRGSPSHVSDALRTSMLATVRTTTMQQRLLCSYAHGSSSADASFGSTHATTNAVWTFVLSPMHQSAVQSILLWFNDAPTTPTTSRSHTKNSVTLRTGMFCKLCSAVSTKLLHINASSGAAATHPTANGASSCNDAPSNAPSNAPTMRASMSSQLCPSVPA